MSGSSEDSSRQQETDDIFLSICQKKTKGSVSFGLECNCHDSRSLLPHDVWKRNMRWLCGIKGDTSSWRMLFSLDSQIPREEVEPNLSPD